MADGEKYLQMAEGGTVCSPFGYRIFVPYIARYLPFDLISNFHILAIFFLITTGCILNGFIKNAAQKKVSAFDVTIILLYLSSFLVAYYSTTYVRVDPLALLILITLFLAGNRGRNIYEITLLTLLGIITHESILFFVPTFWLMYLFNIELLDQKQYTLSQLAAYTGLSFFFFAALRFFLDVEENPNLTYENGVDIIFYVLDYSGGIFKHLQRIFAAYGPVWFLFLSQIFFFEKKNIRRFVLLTIGIMVLMTFMATDTLRVVSLLFPVIFFYSYKFLSFIRISVNNGNWYLGALLFLQGYYSYIVFAHLRSFEHSPVLIYQSIGVSIFFFVLLSALLVNFFKNKKIKQFVEIPG